MKRMLLVDDTKEDRELFKDLLKNDYEITEAENGTDAVEILEKDNNFDIVIIDAYMPIMDGLQTLQAIKDSPFVDNDDFPLIMTCKENKEDIVEAAYDLDVDDFIDRPFSPHIIKRRIKNIIRSYENRKEQKSKLEKIKERRRKDNNIMMDIVSKIVEYRNNESGAHIQNINNFTRLILEALRKEEKYSFLTDRDIDLIVLASSVHDAGKIDIPRSILNKPGKLSEEEFTKIKTHPSVGASMIKKIEIDPDDTLIKYCYEVCGGHHERWDGKGYPRGLKGDEIPISAQVVALADVYDALTAERCYKKPIPHEEAVKMINNGECGTFNPLILEVFNKLSDDLELLASKAKQRFETKDVLFKSIHSIGKDL